MLKNVPVELIGQVFDKMNISSQINMRRTCKDMKQLADKKMALPLTSIYITDSHPVMTPLFYAQCSSDYEVGPRRHSFWYDRMKEKLRDMKITCTKMAIGISLTPPQLEELIKLIKDHKIRCQKLLFLKPLRCSSEEFTLLVKMLKPQKTQFMFNGSPLFVSPNR